MNKEKLLTLLETNNQNGLIQFFSEEDDFQFLKTEMIRFGNSGVRIDTLSLAYWCMHKKRTQGSNSIINSLDKFINCTEIPGFEVLAIYGITTEKSIEITDSIKLIPFSELPDTAAKADYNPYSLTEIDFNPFTPNSEYAHRAIMKKGPHSRVKYPNSALVYLNRPSPKLREENTFYQSMQQELIEVCNCLTLIGPSSPTPVVWWWQAEEWVPDAGMFGYGSLSFGNYSNNYSNHQITDRDLNKIKEIYTAYLNLDNHIKEQIRIPLERLNKSIKNPDYRDAIIDLTIAAEALFLRDSQKELSFRLRLNAAWFLGSDFAERQAIFNLFKDIYEILSKIVHTGKLPKKLNINDIKILTQECGKKVAEALEKIILSNKNEIGKLELILGHTL